MISIYGRDKELNALNRSYKQERSHLIAVYGRRRIGKSYLLKYHCRDKPSILIEGLEGLDSPNQIENFQREFYKQTKSPLLKNAPFTEWAEVFDFISNYISANDKKIVLVLDEIQWMAAKKSKLISLIKMYWDQSWEASKKIQLILCGSIASFMLDQVIHGKALYGRIDLELQIKEMSPKHVEKIVSGDLLPEDFFRWYVILGGVPKYYTLIDPSKSYIQNMESLFYSESGFLFKEMDKIFYSQFKEAKTYEKIVKALQTKIKTSEELAKELHISSGGGFLRYLDVLEKARFISGHKPFEAEAVRIRKYKVFDEYLRFYFKFVRPYQKIILNNTRHNLFKAEVAPKWSPWLGLAFEHFCLKQNNLISKLLEIDDKVIDYGPLFQNDQNHFQIDLMLKTNESEIYVCECKFTQEPVAGDVIAEMQAKLALYPVKKGIVIRKVLISAANATQAVHKSKYFDHIIDLNQLISVDN